jgi:transglutaminase-like putative cysteine protease
MNNYLKPTYYLDCNHPVIQKTINQVTAGCQDEIEVMQKLFLFVRDQIPYNMYAVSGNPLYYRSSKVLEMGTGYCMQKAILFTSLGRAAGVPSRLVLAAIRNHLTPPEVVEILGGNIFFPHAYSQFFLAGRWINIAATYDKPLSERMGTAVLEFNGHDDTLLPETDLAGRRFIEYMENFGTFDDLPWQLITEKMPHYYPRGLEYWFNDGPPLCLTYKPNGSNIE